MTTPLLDGELHGYAKIARDQTSRVQIDTQREAALSSEQAGRSQAETDSALKDEFLAVMSHELRHPLNLIYINAELMSRLPAVREAPAAVRAATVIRNAVASQAKIIDDLLDMSRLSTGKLSLNCHDVDLGDIVAKLMDVVDADPMVASLDVRFQAHDDPLIVRADPVRIEQVVLNLLSNAFKFTPAGGIVTVVLGEDDGHARLDVSDTGAGIAAEFLPQVFQMFRQGGAKAVRNKAGLGIGLALVRQIVELHGGRVEASSPGPGQGSRFTLWLPLAQQAGWSEQAPTASLTAAVAGLRILLVDDMEDSASVFRTLLELEGATVDVVTSAVAGLALLGERPVDLVISDLSMPDMDGFAFLRALRAMPGLATLPAIAASGLGREKDVQAALAAGFSDHITKPIDMELLANKIVRLLAGRQQG